MEIRTVIPHKDSGERTLMPKESMDLRDIHVICQLLEKHDIPYSLDYRFPGDKRFLYIRSFELEQLYSAFNGSNFKVSWNAGLGWEFEWKVREDAR